LELEAIIFDVDGTLAETEEIHRSAFNQAFREAGLPWHWDEPLYGALLAVTGGKERLRHYMASQRLEGDSAASQSLIAALHERKTALYGERVRSGAVTLRVGFDALIREAHRSAVRLAIATTTSLPNVHALLHATLGPEGVSYFEVIAAGDTVARKKPAPDIYLDALAQLRLPPESCVAVEDSRNGLEAACAAGITTLVVRSRYSRLDDFTGAARVLDALDELAGVGPPGPAILEALRALWLEQ
jgi:beta-phosphoglucomutase-like phosphatase (HAD superfamily)